MKTILIAIILNTLTFMVVAGTREDLAPQCNEPNHQICYTLPEGAYMSQEECISQDNRQYEACLKRRDNFLNGYSSSPRRSGPSRVKEK